VASARAHPLPNISHKNETTILEVSTELFEALWINDILIIEHYTQWQTGTDGLIKALQVHSWIRSRDAAMRRSASWSDWSWDTILGEEDATESSIDRESRITFEGLNRGIVAQRFYSEYEAREWIQSRGEVDQQGRVEHIQRNEQLGHRR
jgi:hypothetical protein